MSTDQSAEMETMTTSTTVAKEADFESLCKGCILHCTENVHVAFDAVANTGSFFLIKDTPFHFPVSFTRLSAIANSTGGTLYICGLR